MNILKSKHLLIGGSISLALILLVIWQLQSKKPEVDDNALIAQNEMQESTSTEPRQQIKTVEDAWEWKPFEEKQAKTPAANPQAVAEPKFSVEFDIQNIHEQLKTVKLDQYGDVVVDADALGNLNAVFQSGNLLLDAEAMAELQRLIKLGLPGQAGEQVATIVGNFNDYLRAKKELYELMASSASDIDHMALLDEQIALQEMYMGKEVADKLFVAEEASARYMMESMAMAKDESLSEEERSARQEALREKYEGAQYGIENWASRYQAFKQEKQVIINSGLSQQDMKQQVESLVHTYFTQQELDRIAHMNLGGV